MSSVPWMFVGNVYKDEEAYDYLLENINWSQGSVQMYGKMVPEPRLTAWYICPNISEEVHAYSGKKQDSNIIGDPNIPVSIYLEELCHRVSEYVSKICNKDIVFNSIHFNYYRDGKQYIGYHNDKIHKVGSFIPDGYHEYIASLSFGTKRRFIMKNMKTKEKHEYSLSDGDLFIMLPGCQQQYKHTVPKELRVKDGRINLTFRIS
jgi:alkylated DNA repair dioxygenase AlkB